jgi:hypothetical protein
MNGVMMSTDGIFPSNAFGRFLEYLTEADRVVRLYIEGLKTISRSYSLDPSTMFGSFLVSREPDGPFRQYFTEMDKWATEAQADLDAGTPLLLAHTIVGTWGAFEAAFFDGMVTWLIDKPEARQREALIKARKKIPSAKWDQLGEEEQVRWLVDKLYNPLKHDRPMMDRLIALLNLVGLLGQVDDVVKRTLHEMYLVRNLIAHRASWVDRSFVEACPDLRYAVGDRLAIKQADWLRYESALMKFCLMILNRQSSQLPAPLAASGTEGSPILFAAP